MGSHRPAISGCFGWHCCKTKCPWLGGRTAPPLLLLLLLLLLGVPLPLLPLLFDHSQLKKPSPGTSHFSHATGTMPDHRDHSNKVLALRPLPRREGARWVLLGAAANATEVDKMRAAKDVA